jgi:hypothetical protein
MELQVRRLEVVTLQLLTLLPASCCGGQVKPGPVLVPVHVGNTKAGVPFPREVKYVYGTYIGNVVDPDPDSTGVPGSGSGSGGQKLPQK